ERAQRAGFVFAALVNVADAELTGNSIDQRAVLARHQSNRHSRFSRQRQAHDVGKVKALPFFAVWSPPYAAVGEHAIDVHGDGLDLRHDLRQVLRHLGCSHASQLLDDRLLALQHSLDAVTLRSFNQADVSNQARDSIRFERRGVVRTPHGAIKRDVPLDDAGAEHRGRYARGQPSFVTGVTNRHAITISQHINNPQIQFFVVGRIRTASMQKDEILLAQNFHCMVDLLDRTHSGRQHDRLANGASMAQKVVIGEGRGSDFKAGNFELGYEINGCLIPARREPVNLDLTAIAVNFLVLLLFEFEAAFQIAIRCSKGALPRLRQLLRRVDDIDRSLLKLDGVTVGAQGYVDEFLREIDISIVIDSDFSDHVARSAGSDHLGPQPNLWKLAGGTVIIFVRHRKAPPLTQFRLSFPGRNPTSPA